MQKTPNTHEEQTRHCDPQQFEQQQEQWRSPLMFRDMTYETDAAHMERFRQPQPLRSGYGGLHNLSNLPEEYLADMSAPAFDMSTQQQQLPDMSLGGECLDNITPPHLSETTTESPLGGNEASSYVDSVYRKIMERFDSLRARIARGDKILPSEASYNECATANNDINDCQKDNGVLTTLRQVLTHRDQCGNVTSHVEETSTCERLGDVQPPSYINASDLGVQFLSAPTPARQMNFSENLANITMPSYHGESMPTYMNSEYLSDISSPTFVSDSGAQRRGNGNVTYMSCLADESSPQYMQEMSRQMQSECLDDITAPTFGRSLSRRGRSNNNNNNSSSNRRNQQSTFPSEMLDNVSAPAAFNKSQSRAENSSSSSKRQQQQRMQKSAAVNEQSRSRTRSPKRNIRAAAANCPNDANYSELSNRQQRTQLQLPSECLDNVTPPYNESSTGAATPKRNNRSNRSPPYQQQQQNLSDISAPAWASSYSNRSRSRQQPCRTQPSEFLDEISMPSYGAYSTQQQSVNYGRPQQVYTAENICDVSAPEFNASEPRAMFMSQYIDDISMPSYGQHMGSFGAARREHSMPSGCLEDETMPSFGGVSGASRRQQSMPSEFLQDVSMPSYVGVSNASRRQQTMPSQCLEDLSMPTFGGVSGATRRQPSMPSRCLENETMPSFGGVSGASRRQQTIPSGYLENETMPSFG
ncbi:CG2750, partial [Drosophila busckii]